MCLDDVLPVKVVYVVNKYLTTFTILDPSGSVIGLEH